MMSSVRVASLFRRPLISGSTLHAHRSFHRSIIPFNNNTGSLFGSLTDQQTVTKPTSTTEKQQVAPATEEALTQEADTEVSGYVQPKDDVKLQEYLHPDPIVAIDKFLTPLKKEIYLANVAKNGFFKNEDEVQISNGKKYTLKLSKEEIETLEPSIYLKSYRIKSSMKKATVVLRLLRELKLKTAITQCQFITKKIARECSDLLRRGLADAESLGYDANKVYIAQIWSGSDGGWFKRLEAKGRGRHGVITHRFIHIRCILKTEQTLKRLQWEKQVKLDALKAKKPLINPLVSSPLRFKVQGYYKW